MKLSDLCVLDVAYCTADITVHAAAKLMRQHHTGDLVVIDQSEGGREPVGMITDRDIVVQVLAIGRDPSMTRVMEVMNAPLVIASGSEDLDTALDRMREHGVRRLPIVDDAGNLLGIVTLDDLLRVHARQAGALLDVISKEQTREHRVLR